MQSHDPSGQGGAPQWPAGAPAGAGQPYPTHDGQAQQAAQPHGGQPAAGQAAPAAYGQAPAAGQAAPAAYGQPQAAPAAYGQAQAAPAAYGQAQPAGQAGAMPGAGGADDPAALNQLLGFELQAGERVLYFKRRMYGSDAAALWFLGLFFLILLFGIFLIYLALTVHQRKPRALVITNMRFVIVGGDGSVTAHWLQQFRDVDPVRVKGGGSAGGGLVGALVVSAVNAGLNAAAASNEKFTPKFWARTDKLILRGHQGQDVTIDVKHDEPPAMGPLLVQCLQYGASEQLPSVPTETIKARCDSAVPTGAGGKWLGVVLLVLGLGALVFAVDELASCNGYMRGEHWGALAFGLLFLASGVGAMLLGGRIAIKGAEARGKPFVGFRKTLQFVIPAVLLVLGLSGVSAVGVARHSRCSDYSSSDERGSKKSRKKKLSSSRSGKGSKGVVKGASLAKLEPAAVTRILKAEGYTFSSSSKGVEKRDEWEAVFYNWDMDHKTRSGVWIGLWDFSQDRKHDFRVVHYGVTPRFAFAAEVSAGDAASGDEAAKVAKPLVAKLEKMKLTGGKSIVAALSASGYRLTDPLDEDDEFTFAHRSFLCFAEPKKGRGSLTLHLLDYSAAVAGEEGSALAVDGKRVLLVSATFGGKSEGKDLLNKLLGK